nr:protein kinase [Acinetobacter sp. Marseille-Q1620]
MRKLNWPKTLGPLCNSIKSQNFGRRLYLITLDNSQYWVKLQIKAINSEYEKMLQNELKVYELFKQQQQPDQGFLLDAILFDVQDLPISTENFLKKGLLVPHVEPLFLNQTDMMSLDRVIRIMKLSLDVVEKLHQSGWIHGDLKREHFRFQQQQAYLIDFEQTQKIEGGLGLKTLNATPRYMAPELFHQSAKSIQTDLYALGIVWLEWITQSRIPAKSYQEWAVLHCQQLEINLPDRFSCLHPVFEKILAKAKGQRFSNIYQIKQALSDYV